MGWFKRLKIDSPRKRFRIRIRICLIFVGAIFAFIMSILIEESQYLWAILPAFGLLIISIGEFVIADILTDNRFPKETEKLLEKLQKKLTKCEASINNILNSAIQEIPNTNNAEISATFHLRIDIFGNVFFDKKETALVQIISYSGPNGGKRWRITPATKGIIGRCLRTAEQENVYFDDIDEFNSRMIKEFGFTQDEIEKISDEARSYLAYPVKHNSVLVGVLYFFSTSSKTFKGFLDNDNIVSKSAASIASFLDGAEII